LISLAIPQLKGGYFCLYSTTGVFATTLALANFVNRVVNRSGIGFQIGIHTLWQLFASIGTCAPTLTDMGASFAIATGGVLTLFIAASPNGSSV
jgi:hypothetical protein